jgi:cytochrome c oxidase cbb3-type subunit 3
LAIACISYALAQTSAEPVGDPALGKKRFESQCALCHGQTGGGGRGPSLQKPKLDHAPDETTLKKVISEGLPPEMPGAWQLNDREVASVAIYVRTLGEVKTEPLAGDPSRGESVYKTKGCAGCHMIRGDGSGYGPELTDIGAKRSPAHLRESLVAPEASVPDGFLMLELVTSGGATIRGIRMNEDTFSIQVKDSSSKFHSFRKSALQEVRRMRGKSPMPSYEKTLSPTELTDLIAYLAMQRGKS